MKEITIGIPAYKAHNFIIRCLASIQIQSIIDKLQIIIANDLPEDDYSYLTEIFPDLDLVLLDCKENTGPGLARQRILDNCVTPWVIFIDADDVFYSPFAVENLYDSIEEGVVMIQGGFVEEAVSNKIIYHNDKCFQPWVFARLFNIQFLRENNIRFSSLRASEDYEFCQKINLLLWEKPESKKYIDDTICIWKRNMSSITRVGIENEIPQYQFDLCYVGIVQASLNILEFYKEKLEYYILEQFCTEVMISLFMQCEQCKIKAPLFYDQNVFNAKRFYNKGFKLYSHKNIKSTFNDIITVAKQDYDFEEFLNFLNFIASQPYLGLTELYDIRNNLPQDIINNAKLTGVVGKTLTLE